MTPTRSPGLRPRWRSRMTRRRWTCCRRWRLSPAVGARIFAGTGGNPLALVEVARELSPAQLAGAEALPEPLPAGDMMQKVFSLRLSRLPDEVRLLAAIAAAEPTAPQT